MPDRELGRVLKERRIAVGMPRATLARRVGISESYVWLIERADSSGTARRPSRAVLERWAKALGWEPKYVRHVLALGGHEVTGASAPRTPSRALLRTGAMHFPQPRKVEHDALQEELEELLREASKRSPQDAEEAIRLLRSFLTWLRFRLETDE